MEIQSFNTIPMYAPNVKRTQEEGYRIRCQVLISDLKIVPVKQKTNRFNPDEIKATELPGHP